MVEFIIQSVPLKKSFKNLVIYSPPFYPPKRSAVKVNMNSVFAKLFSSGGETLLYVLFI